MPSQGAAHRPRVHADNAPVSLATPPTGWVEQIAFADRIILNKCDLVEKDDIAQLKVDIRAINRSADFIESVKSEVDPAKLININRFSKEETRLGDY